jgi:integration host factor subunit beta
LGYPVIKSELVLRIADRNPTLYRSDVLKIVDAILEEIVAGLANGDRIELRGFGVFSARQRSSRPGRNPRTGQQVVVPERAIPFFRPGKELRERLITDPHEGRARRA